MTSISRLLVGFALAMAFVVPAVSHGQSETDLTDHDVEMLGESVKPAEPVPAAVQIKTLETPSTYVTTGTGSFGDSRTFASLVDQLIVYFNYFIYIITALTVVYTVIGAFHMIGGEEKREEGKTAVYYGVIGLFVMMSIWGLVNILDATFKLSGSSPITPRPIERGGYYGPGY